MSQGQRDDKEGETGGQGGVARCCPNSCISQWLSPGCSCEIRRVRAKSDAQLYSFTHLRLRYMQDIQNKHTHAFQQKSSGKATLLA